MAGEQMQRTKVLKVSYYLTLLAEVELEVSEEESGDEAVRAFLPDIPAHKFNVVTADYAEVDDEEQGKRCIALT